jgi:phage shock protein PspC (stress-responsive transcriptional regulator)
MAERLYRSRDDRMLAGVAAGVAETLDADPSLVRIAWALLTIFTGGIAFLVYIVMAIVVPEAPAGWTAAPSPWSPGGPAPSQAPGAPAPIAPATAAAPTTPAAEPMTPEASSAPLAQSAPPPTYWASERDARRAARRARREAREPGRGGLVVGIVLIVLGGAFLVREFVPWFDWHVWWPLGLIALGGLLLLLALRPGQSD